MAFNFTKYSIASIWFSTTLFLITHRQVITTEDDDRFVALYGNDVNTSGIWQRARDLASDVGTLKNISYEAHMAVWPYYPHGIEIDAAFVTTETLMHPGTAYKDIRADLIGYHLAGLSKNVIFYLTKGLKPDCVFYVWKITKVKGGPKWELKIPVCELSV